MSQRKTYTLRNFVHFTPVEQQRDFAHKYKNESLPSVHVSAEKRQTMRGERGRDDGEQKAAGEKCVMLEQERAGRRSARESERGRRGGSERGEASVPQR